MSVLGTMMLRAGLLSESQAAAANEQAASRSSSHVDAILELGLADEDTLVAFLASKLMIPRVRAGLLERVDGPTLQRVSPALAWKFRCVPVSADELGNLTVAMTDPTDHRAITAIAEHTGAYLVRAVGSASELRRAVARHYGSEQDARAQLSPPVVAPQAAPQVAPPRISSAPQIAPPRISSAPQVAPPQISSAPLHATPPQVTAPQVTPDSEAERTTEIGLEPVRYSSPPPGIRNPAPQGPLGAVPFVPGTNPGPTMVATAADIGIPSDDDDDHDVPIRTGAVAREVHARPTPPHGSSEPLDTRPTLVEQRRGPITDIQTGPPADDFHERPTFVETQGLTESHASAGRNVRRPRAHTPWNPPLQGYTPPEPIPLSPDAFAQVLPLLEAATDRDAVTTLLLDFLGAGFNRVILFVHSHNELRGLDARGKDLLVEAVRQVRIPSTGKSMFSNVLERGGPYLGSIQSNNKIDMAFSQALGGVKGNVLLLPITIGTKIPLLLWAHGSSHPVDPRSINELSVAVSDAIQRILRRR